MTFLPIVERELRVGARRRSTYFLRLTGAILAMAFGGWILTTMSHVPPGQLGGFLFGFLSSLLFIYAIGAGVRSTADCLSEEKREGTLGLLFLTDLKGYDVVAGKLAANSLNTFYGMFSALPILAISLLMGGVTSGQFWRVSLVATNLLFFSLSVGMFSSAVCREERKANSFAILVMALFLGATPLIELGMHLANSQWQGSTGLMSISPAYACVTAFNGKAHSSNSAFWVSAALTHLYGWLFLSLASSIVPRAWQDKGAQKSILFRSLGKTIFRANPNRENIRRVKFLEINPVLWLTARDFSKSIFIWITLGALAIAWIWAAAKWPKDWLTPPVYIMTAICLHSLLKFWIASEACSRFIEDRKSGAMELLLSTPMKVEEILRGQRLALFRQFAAPAILVILIDIAFLIACLHQERPTSSDLNLWIILWLVGGSIFIMDMLTLAWLSMWIGLNTGKINRASGSALSRVLVLPWVVFIFFSTIFLSGLHAFNWNGEVLLLIWCGISAANNLVQMTWAKENLRTRFREIATQRFDKKASSWRNWTSPSPETELPPIIQSQ